ncbi:MAG: phage tail assembly chaperone [Clostridia bacterium]|nr:phage tail assembly chaperone [Clostridia bacterium]
MKISSTVMPNKAFEILRNGTKCTAIFYTNITSNAVIDGMTGQSVNSWDYEKYELKMNYSPSLSAQITADYDTWLAKAKGAEKNMEAQKVRDYRDNLLNECDIKHCNPEKWTAMTDTEKLAWATYKQSLRDVTVQEGFPYTVNWAVMPADTTGKLSDVLAAAAGEKKQGAYMQSALAAIQSSTK